MKNEFKTEFYRVMHSPGMLFSLGVGIVIAVAQILLDTVPVLKYVNEGSYPLSAFAKWLGGDNTSLFATLYYFVVPILCAIPFAGTLKEEMESGYTQNVVTRVKKESYFRTKYIVTFLSAGIVAVVPLLVNFFFTASLLPMVIPQANTALFPIFSYSLLGDLFYSHPLVYLMFYLLLNFVFFGLLTTTALMATFICNNVFTTVLAPFILYLFLDAFTQITGWSGICPFKFLRPSQPIAADAAVIVVEISLLLVAGGIFDWIAKRKEIY